MFQLFSVIKNFVYIDENLEKKKHYLIIMYSCPRADTGGKMHTIKNMWAFKWT